MSDPFKDYERLQKRLRTASKSVFVENDNSTHYDIEKAIERSSSKHHYLPQYYIDGFLATDGLLDMYDKSRDTIKRERKGSGGVFFEPNRNSTDFGFSKPISLFEDAYSVLDNLLPAAIKLLRSDAVNISNEIFTELIANLNVFIIDLFWRNINTDKLFDDLYKNGKMTITVSNAKVISTEETLLIKDIPGFKQLARLQMLKTTLKEAMTTDLVTRGELICFPMDQICLGDMPFLFPFIPDSQIGFNALPVIVPISKSKIYCRNIERRKPFNFTDTCMFNALIIEHSSKLICSSNRTILEGAIDYYHFAKNNNCFDTYRSKLFFDGD